MLTDSLKFPSARHLATLCGILLLVSLGYGNTLGNGFVFDDERLVVENGLIRQVATWPKLLTSDYWVTRYDPLGDMPATSGLYRPLVHLSFALNYALDGLNPVGYHLVNILLHLSITLMVYLTARQIGSSPTTSMIAAVLFGVHPIHTEVVAWVSGRAELLMALGVMSSWYFHLIGRQAWSMAAFLLALASKEQALVLPGLLLLSDVCTQTISSSGVKGLTQVKDLGRRYGLSVLILALWILLRFVALGWQAAPSPNFVDNPLAHVDVGTRLFTATKIAGMYVWLCIWPAALSVDYSYDSIGLVSKVGDPWLLMSASVWAMLIVLSLRAYRRGAGRIALATGVMILTFLPASNILLPIGTTMAERLFYLPSVGFAMLAGEGAVFVQRGLSAWQSDGISSGAGGARTAWTGYLVWGVLGVVCAALLSRTVTRNRDWRSLEQLFTGALQSSAQNAKAHAVLGVLAKGRQDSASRQRALDHFQTALSIYPSYVREDPEFSGNLGDTLYLLGRVDEAIGVLSQAFQADPTQGRVLGLLYARQRRPDRAESIWRETLAYSPNDAETRALLGRLLVDQGRYSDGLAEVEAVLVRHPEMHESLLTRALALEALGRSQEAVEGYEALSRLRSAPEEARQEAQMRLKRLRSLAPSRGNEERCPPGLSRCGKAARAS